MCLSSSPLHRVCAEDSLGPCNLPLAQTNPSPHWKLSKTYQGTFYLSQEYRSATPRGGGNGPGGSLWDLVEEGSGMGGEGREGRVGKAASFQFCFEAQQPPQCLRCLGLV